MEFVETLKSIGGVKPCPSCSKDPNDGLYDARSRLDATMKALGEAIKHLRPNGYNCPAGCHGTGQIIDLAPLLAKPTRLPSVVWNLLHAADKQAPDLKLVDKAKLAWDDPRFVGGEKGEDSDLIIVSPARCATLGYEVARQLGGTAVVAEKVNADVCPDCSEIIKNTMTSPCHMGRVLSGYHLSLTIPPDAMVLFVTDRFSRQEVLGMIDLVATEKILPYVLCLVSADDTVDGKWKIISLHQEK